MIVPINRIAVIPIIEASNPIVFILRGRRNVPIAEPIRLNAVTKPTPDARISVGKSSAGYVSVRFEFADNIKVKARKIGITKILGS